jgi:hypothetical protein
MEIKLTPAEAEEYFYNALCNGLGYFQQYGVEVDFTKEAYSKAKKRIEKNPTNFSEMMICYEDVLMEILRGGDKLEVVDQENDDPDLNVSITLADVHDRVAKTPIRHLMDMINENDDADTGDVILQSVFFQDVIFG